MTKIAFIGPAYEDASLNFDAQRCINQEPVKSETEDSKSIAKLQGTPGLLSFASAANASRTRASIAVNGRAFKVVGARFYEVFSNGTTSEPDADASLLLTDAGFVSIAHNGTQVCFVDGANGYIFTLATNELTVIVDVYFLGANTVTFCDGYFVFNKPNTQIYYLSALYDGTTGDPTQFASAEGSPDNLVGVKTFHKEVWLFGKESIEVAYNSGALDFPFTRIKGAFIEYGCLCAGSIAKTANAIFWIGNDKDGNNVVWMATGYQPTKISNFGVDDALSRMTNSSDCTAYTYQLRGHYFLVLNFTTDNQTWVYDVALGAWHERLAWNQTTGQYERHWAEGYINIFGKLLVGDYRTGNIYQLTYDAYDDNGTFIRRERVSQHRSDDLELIECREFKLDMEVGVGISSGAAEDMDPMIELSWSDDGGHTYKNPHLLSVGKIGDTKKRVIKRNCGQYRTRCWKTVYTARTKYTVIAAHVNEIPGIA